jgi:hypothetical protein
MASLQWSRTLYVVKKRDTLMRIAKHTWARGGWRGIAADNHLRNPNIIHLGQILEIYVPVAVDEKAFEQRMPSDVQTTMVANGSLKMRAVTEPLLYW